MSESTSTPTTTTPGPTPNPTTPKRSRSAINQNWIEELNDAGQIAAAAQKPEFNGEFAKGGIDASKLAALTTDIVTAQKLAGDASRQTFAKEGVTENETQLKDALVVLLQQVQSRAKQKYAGSNPLALKDYAVGEKYYSSRPLLEQAAANILAKLGQDSLPGIDAAKIAEIQSAANAYRDVQTNQTGSQSGATTARTTLEAAVKNIIVRRREIQFAADAQWPASNPVNAGIRRMFQLPPDRAFK